MAPVHMCETCYLHNLLTTLGAVSVFRLPSQLHQDLPGICGLLHGGFLHKETKKTLPVGKSPAGGGFYLLVLLFENGRCVLPCLTPHTVPPE